jgi:tetratricopeptide (TPR) repeat protein
MTLGAALVGQGKLEEGVIAYREAIRLKPDFAECQYSLGHALSQLGKTDEAITAYRETIRVKPDHAEAHCNLAGIFRNQGRYAEALQSVTRGHELGSRKPGWRYPSAEWVATAKRQAELAERLPAILKGDATPKDNTERLDLAGIAYATQHYTAAVRLWDEGLRADPKLADDRRHPQHRYDAACAAALAAAGQGKGDLPADEAAKARLRAQALDWLKAELAAWVKHLDKNPNARPLIVQTMLHWKADSDLVGVREPRALEALPEPERGAWRAFWAEVDRTPQPERKQP